MNFDVTKQIFLSSYYFFVWNVFVKLYLRVSGKEISLKLRSVQACLKTIRKRKVFGRSPWPQIFRRKIKVAFNAFRVFKKFTLLFSMLFSMTFLKIYEVNFLEPSSWSVRIRWWDEKGRQVSRRNIFILIKISSRNLASLFYFICIFNCVWSSKSVRRFCDI